MSKYLVKILILTQWMTLFGGIFASYIEEYRVLKTIPESVTPTTGIQEAMLWGSAICFLAYLVSSFGILMYKNWARWMYFWSQIWAHIPFPSLYPETIDTPISNMLDVITTGCIVLTLITIFFSDIKQAFTHHPQIHHAHTRLSLIQRVGVPVIAFFLVGGINIALAGILTGFPRLHYGEHVIIPWGVCFMGILFFQFVWPLMGILALWPREKSRSYILLWVFCWSVFWFFFSFGALDKAWRRGL